MKLFFIAALFAPSVFAGELLSIINEDAVKRAAAQIAKIVDFNTITLKPIFNTNGETLGDIDQPLTAALAKALVENHVTLDSQTHDYLYGANGQGYQPYGAQQQREHAQPGRFIVEGTLKPLRADSSRSIIGTILNIDIETREGRPLPSFEQRLEDPLQAALLFGLSGDLQVDGKRDKDFAPDFRINSTEPEIDAKGITLFSSPRQRYGIQIAVRENQGGKWVYVPRKIQVQENVPFVNLKLGEVYSVRTVNNDVHGAAVQILVDGINILSGQTQFSQFAIHQAQANGLAGVNEFKGYVLSSTDVNEFKVSHAQQSKAAQTFANPEQTGVISVVFSELRKKAGYEPPYEPPHQAPYEPPPAKPHPPVVGVAPPGYTAPVVGGGYTQPLGSSEGERLGGQDIKILPLKGGEPQSVISIRYFPE